MHAHTQISILFFSFYDSIQIKHFAGDKHICYHNQDYAPTFFSQKKIEFQEKY